MMKTTILCHNDTDGEIWPSYAGILNLEAVTGQRIKIVSILGRTEITAISPKPWVPQSAKLRLSRLASELDVSW